MSEHHAYGAIEEYQDNELVVALPDCPVVTEALTGLGVKFPKPDRDERLGLALLHLHNVPDAVKGLPEYADLVQRVTRAKWPGDLPQRAGGPSDLDVLLYALCEEFSARYSGWIPEVGKNRTISPVVGFPHVSGCTEGDPRLLGFADPQLTGDRQGWPPRPTEPGHGVQVGLLDTRMYRNPWLDGSYLGTANDLFEIPSSGDLPAREGHATFVAGLILQQAPGARLILHTVMGPQAVGKTWDVAKAMVQAASKGVHILNLSFGCYTDDGQPPLVLAKAVHLISRDVLLVAAAGNHGNIEQLRAKGDPAAAAPWMQNIKDTTPVWPAALPEVTAVGATDANGDPAPFSPNLPWVDVTAPGAGVKSTYLEGLVRLSYPAPDSDPTEKFDGLACWDGTSFAAGTVSGAVAARIGPGCDARQALEAALNDSSRSGIQRFPRSKGGGSVRSHLSSQSSGLTRG
jgi:membrane-anchored mycosin MYCP